MRTFSVVTCEHMNRDISDSYSAINPTARDLKAMEAAARRNESVREWKPN
jgi:hypothetical protein